MKKLRPVYFPLPLSFQFVVHNPLPRLNSGSALPEPPVDFRLSAAMNLNLDPAQLSNEEVREVTGDHYD